MRRRMRPCRRERLGHSSIRITLDTYSHVIKGMQQVAVSKLDEIEDGW